MGRRGKDRDVDRPAWSSRTVLRYTLLQIPGLVLLVLLLLLVQRWVDLPTWFVCGLVAFWAAKDVILFFYTWRAYDHERDADPMTDARGIATERLDPAGRVQVRGELWRAEAIGDGRPIEKGARVRVREIRGLTLLVEQDSGGD